MNGIAARRAPSVAPGQAPEGAAASARTLGGRSSSAEGVSARANSGRMRVGLLRQSAYVAIDVAMVMVGGAALDFVFSRAHAFATSLPALAQLTARVSALSPGFL